mgnify:CR=1 FL=1
MLPVEHCTRPPVQGTARSLMCWGRKKCRAPTCRSAAERTSFPSWRRLSVAPRMAGQKDKGTTQTLVTKKFTTTHSWSLLLLTSCWGTATAAVAFPVAVAVAVAVTARCAGDAIAVTAALLVSPPMGTAFADRTRLVTSATDTRPASPEAFRFGCRCVGMLTVVCIKSRKFQNNTGRRSSK